MIEQIAGTSLLRELGAKIRNIFSIGDFQKRYADGDLKDAVQVKTHNGRVVEKKEAFPYGFYAKAKSGRVFVFCQGGNLDGFEIFPVLPGDDVTPPELEEGDAALYTGSGGVIIAREAGAIEVYAKGEGRVTVTTEKGGVEINAGGGGALTVTTEKGDIVISAAGSGKIKIMCEDGKFFLGNSGMDNCALLAGLIDEIKAIVTAGSPASQTVNPASQQKLEAYKNKIKQLYAESA
jgi:phage gp45-like